MNWPFILLAAFLSVLIVRWIFKPSSKDEDAAARKNMSDLPLWVETLNIQNQSLAVGRRLAWLPPAEFGHGACILIGAINLAHADEALRTSIEKHFHPIYLDENLILAHIIAKPNQTEDLIIGPLADEILQKKIETAHTVTTNEIDVIVEVSSSSVGLMESDESRRAFTEIWQQHVSVLAKYSVRQPKI